MSRSPNPQLVPGQPRPRETISNARGRPRTKNPDSEVQQPADDEYFERETYDEEGESNQPAEQFEHHAHGKEAQHGE